MASATHAKSAAPRRTLWERLDDAMNPIVVKELRQAVQSRFVAAVLNIFLLIQLAWIGIMLLTSGVRGRLEAIDFQEGRDIFFHLQVILLGTCMLFIPLYTAVRLAAERNEANADLLFITTIKPRSIIGGKLFSAMVLAVLIFSACIPFMALTFYLRGIDWLTILLVLGIDFLVIITCVQLMVFLAVIPCNLIFKVFLSLAGLVMLMTLFGWTLGGTAVIVHEGALMGLIGTTEFWAVVVVSVFSAIALCGLLFAWSVALLHPSSANRMLPVRLYTAALWLVSIGVVTLACIMVAQTWPVLIWLPLATALCSLNLFIAINERRDWSPRIARTIPRFFVLRCIAFFFFTGAAGGVLFSTILMGLSLLVAWALPILLAQHWGISSIGVASTEFDSFFFGCLTLFLYAYCYSLSAVFAQNLLRRSIAPIFTWLVMLLLLALGTVVPYLGSFLFYMDNWHYDDLYLALIPSPFTFLIYESFQYHGRVSLRDIYLMTLTAWALVATVINIPWFFRQFFAFRPPEELPVVTVAEEEPIGPTGVSPPPFMDQQPSSS